MSWLFTPVPLNDGGSVCVAEAGGSRHRAGSGNPSPCVASASTQPRSLDHPHRGREGPGQRQAVLHEVPARDLDRAMLQGRCAARQLRHAVRLRPQPPPLMAGQKITEWALSPRPIAEKSALWQRQRASSVQESTLALHQRPSQDDQSCLKPFLHAFCRKQPEPSG